MESLNFMSIILIAFLGSFGHCIGMCGGIVLAYTSTKVDSSWNKAQQSISHLFYAVGRITTYTILGALFGYFGSVVSFSRLTGGVLLFLTGLLMVLVGLSLMGKLKFLTNIEHSVSKMAWYQKSFKRLLNSNNLFSFYFLGMLNGLLPCGFVYFFAITAASTANVFWGAMVMFVFGLSTVPAMFSLAFFIGIFKQNELRELFIKIAAILVIGFGLFTIYNGYNYTLGTYNPEIKSSQ
jgi:sulfite exporter TauE/SafE